MDTCNQQLARNPKNGWVGFPLWESSQQAEGLDQARENPCQKTAFGAKLLYIAPVAQGIEQRIPNPCAAGSIPAGGTMFQRPMTLSCPPRNPDKLHQLLCD